MISPLFSAFHFDIYRAQKLFGTLVGLVWLGLFFIRYKRFNCQPCFHGMERHRAPSTQLKFNEPLKQNENQRRSCHLISATISPRYTLMICVKSNTSSIEYIFLPLCPLTCAPAEVYFIYFFQRTKSVYCAGCDRRPYPRAPCPGLASAAPSPSIHLG